MYQHILLATDLAPDTDIVAERAAALAAAGTRLSLVHVIEPLAMAYGAEMPLDLATLQEEITRQASTRLNALAKRLDIPHDRVVLCHGVIEKEILRVAQDAQADLIVLGSHSRRGLAVLLGSTAQAVLHHASCDVLAVRIARQ